MVAAGGRNSFNKQIGLRDHCKGYKSKGSERTLKAVGLDGMRRAGDKGVSSVHSLIRKGVNKCCHACPAGGHGKQNS